MSSCASQRLSGGSFEKRTNKYDGIWKTKTHGGHFMTDITKAFSIRVGSEAAKGGSPEWPSCHLLERDMNISHSTSQSRRFCPEPRLPMPVRRITPARDMRFNHATICCFLLRSLISGSKWNRALFSLDRTATLARVRGCNVREMFVLPNAGFSERVPSSYEHSFLP